MPINTETTQNKHFALEKSQLTNTQKVLIAKTEAEINEKAWQAHNKFIKNAVKENLIIEDVFGRFA